MSPVAKEFAHLAAGLWYYYIVYDTKNPAYHPSVMRGILIFLIMIYQLRCVNH